MQRARTGGLAAVLAAAVAAGFVVPLEQEAPSGPAPATSSSAAQQRDGQVGPPGGRKAGRPPAVGEPLVPVRPRRLPRLAPGVGGPTFPMPRVAPQQDQVPRLPRAEGEEPGPVPMPQVVPGGAESFLEAD